MPKTKNEKTERREGEKLGRESERLRDPPALRRRVSSCNLAGQISVAAGKDSSAFGPSEQRSRVESERLRA